MHPEHRSHRSRGQRRRRLNGDRPPLRRRHQGIRYAMWITFTVILAWPYNVLVGVLSAAVVPTTSLIAANESESETVYHDADIRNGYIITSRTRTSARLMSVYAVSTAHAGIHESNLSLDDWRGPHFRIATDLALDFSEADTLERREVLFAHNPIVARGWPLLSMTAGWSGNWHGIQTVHLGPYSVELMTHMRWSQGLANSLVAACCVSLAIRTGRFLLRLRRSIRNQCEECGYSQTGLPDPVVCPECGVRFRGR